MTGGLGKRGARRSSGTFWGMDSFCSFLKAVIPANREVRTADLHQVPLKIREARWMTAVPSLPRAYRNFFRFHLQLFYRVFYEYSLLVAMLIRCFKQLKKNQMISVFRFLKPRLRANPTPLAPDWNNIEVLKNR